MDVLPLQILDNLGFNGCRIAEFDDSHGYGLEFSQLCRSEPSCSGCDLVLVLVAGFCPDDEWLQNALRLEAFRQLFQAFFIESLSWIAGRFFKNRDCDIAVFTVVLCLLVLHTRSPYLFGFV